MRGGRAMENGDTVIQRGTYTIEFAFYEKMPEQMGSKDRDMYRQIVYRKRKRWSKVGLRGRE